MADGTTTNYGFTLPEVGASEDTWGTKLNQNWSDLDADLKSIADDVAANTSAVENIELFPVGTAMLFAQTTAPTGWTKSTTHNNKALRVVSGTASSGGNSAFTTAFGNPSVSGNVNVNGNPSSGNLDINVSGNVGIGNTSLSINQIPSHTHAQRMGTDTQGGSAGGSANRDDNARISLFNNVQTGARGGNGAHNHSANFSGSGNVNGAPGRGNLGGSLSSANASINVQYVDVIIATKD